MPDKKTKTRKGRKPGLPALDPRYVEEVFRSLRRELGGAGTDVGDIKREVEDSGKHIDAIKRGVEDAGKDVDEIKREVLDSGKDIDKIREEVLDTGKDVDRIKEEILDAGRDVDEIKEGVEEVKAAQRSLLQRFSSRVIPDKFQWDDLAQQIVGAVVLSTPLAVTQEVWELALAMGPERMALVFAVTLVFDILLIYYTKFQAVENTKVFNFIPIRLVSLLVVSYIASAAMLLIFGVIGIEAIAPFEAVKIVLFVGLFANIGAAAADLLR